MVNKKEYIKPSMKAVVIEETETILAGSDPITYDLYDDEVVDYGGEDSAPTGYGVQW